jgi:hypothetical protein
METQEYRRNGISVLEIIDDSVVIGCVQDLLDIISDYSVKSIVLQKHNIDEDFFDLKTGFAGEILQKATNYRLRIGIIGDFSTIESQSFKDFMYESNQTKKIIFKPTVEDALRVFLREK